MHLDNDLRILAAACKHQVPQTSANLEQIIDQYQRKSRVLLNQSSDDSMFNYRPTLHDSNQMSNNCTFPVTINTPRTHNINIASPMPNPPHPNYGAQRYSSPTRMNYQHPSPNVSPIQHQTYGDQSPTWMSPSRFESYRWNGPSPRPRYHSPLNYYRGHRQNTPSSDRYSQSKHNASKRKRLDYRNPRSAEELGKKFRQSLGATSTSTKVKK